MIVAPSLSRAFPHGIGRYLSRMLRTDFGESLFPRGWERTHGHLAVARHYRRPRPLAGLHEELDVAALLTDLRKACCLQLALHLAVRQRPKRHQPPPLGSALAVRWSGQAVRSATLWLRAGCVGLLHSRPGWQCRPPGTAPRTSHPLAIRLRRTSVSPFHPFGCLRGPLKAVYRPVAALLRVYSYWTASTMLLRAAVRAGSSPAKTPIKSPERRAARAGILG